MHQPTAAVLALATAVGIAAAGGELAHSGDPVAVVTVAPGGFDYRVSGEFLRDGSVDRGQLRGSRGEEHTPACLARDSPHLVVRLQDRLVLLGARHAGCRAALPTGCRAPV